MAINSSDSKSSIWKHVKYSIEFSFTFVKKYPFVAHTLLFFILFYALSPSITWFFIYSLPLLFFFTILLIVFFSIPNFTHFSRDDQKIKEDNGIDNKQKAFLRARSVRRRKSKNYIEAGDDEESKGGALSRIPFNDHDFVDKGALIEEKLKDIREVEVHSVSDHAECSSSSIFKNSRHEHPDCSYEANVKPFKSYCSMYERKTEYLGETAEVGARNKAVQWKEDDGKNLMDLGLSEIERTKRLESLIARRRARKMLSLQVRRSLMNIGNKENFVPISSLIIPKNKSTSGSQFSPTPGSAPSILGPNRNPFDLPYDQHEEKPNLRGGSFMQEFMSAHEQDLMFSRHESFTRGATTPGNLNLDHREPTICSDHPSRQRFSEASQHSNPRHRLGREDNDKVAEEVPSQASEPEMNVSYEGDNSGQGLDTSQDEKDSSDIQIKTVLVEDISNRTSSSSSSEEDEPFYKIDKDAILKSIASPALRSFAGDPSHPSSSLLENTREDEQFYYPNRSMHRTPCQSIASGLQVKVSEVGSPPLTNDSSSSADEEISIDGEIEKAIVSSNDDALMSSSHLARVDENESRSIEVREVTEQDIVEFGFSRFQMSQNNVPHNNPSERLTEPDSIGSSSFPPPRTERSQASSYQQCRPEGVSVVNERFQASLLQPEFAVQPPFPSPSLPSPTSVLQPDCLIEQGSSNYDQFQNDRAVNISSERSDSIASQESVFSLNNSTLQVSELPSETDNSVSAKENDSDGEQLSEEVVFSTIGQGHHSTEVSSTSSSKSVSQPKFATDLGSSSNFSQQTPMDTLQVEPQRVKNKLPNEVTAESCDPKTSPSSTLLTNESTAQSSVPNSQAQKFSNNSKSLISNDFQEALCDDGGQHIEVVAFPTTSQSFDDSQASSSPQDLVVGQVQISSSSSLFSSSMIQPRFSINEGFSNSQEQKRVQDPIPDIKSERAANQDFSSLQSSVREVPTASSSSSSPKSGLQPKSTTGQGPPLISDLEKQEEIKQFDGQTMKNNLPEEQIGESSGPSMSRNTRTLLNDSVADQHHPADAKTDQPRMSLKEVSESHTELPDKTTMVSSNSTTKHQKSSDVSSSATASTNNNENSDIGTGDDRGARELEITHGPTEGESTVAKGKIESHSERIESKEKVKD